MVSSAHKEKDDLDRILSALCGISQTPSVRTIVSVLACNGSIACLAVFER